MNNRKIGKALLCASMAGAMLLGGCDSKDEPSADALAAAINKSLATNGNLCLSMNNWPVVVEEFEVSREDKNPTGRARRMSVLAKMGLVTQSETVVDQTISGGVPTGRKLRTRTYSLTPEGRKYFNPEVVELAATAGSSAQVKGDLCYGRKVVSKVIKWDLLPELAPQKAYNVRYNYKVDQLAPWASTPEFLAAFTGVSSVLGEADKAVITHGVYLTPDGWKAKGQHQI